MPRFSSSVLQRSVPLDNHFSWRPLLKRSPTPPAYSTALLFLLILLTAAFISSLWASTLFSSDYEATNITIANQTSLVSREHGKSKPSTTKQIIELPFSCAAVNGNHTQTCSTPHQTTSLIQNDEDEPSSGGPVCPEYFRWIHEDLGPWKAHGITREMVEKANRTAHFRLVIIKGRAYVETYKKSIQTRDAFTIWGILQLLRRYPGRLPDLELMFDCNDRPVIRASHYLRSNMTAPPPLFRYCGDRWTHDIVFPDWSFWGW